MSRSRGSRSGSRRDWKEIVKKIAVITWKVIKFIITKVLPFILKILWLLIKYSLILAFYAFIFEMWVFNLPFAMSLEVDKRKKYRY